MKLYSISKWEAEKLLNENITLDEAGQPLDNEPIPEYLARLKNGYFEPLERHHLENDSVVGFFVLVE